MNHKNTIEVLSSLKKFIYETVMLSHSCQKTADSCANKALSVISLNFASRLMYIPSCFDLNKNKIKEQIKKEFNGSNHFQLCLKYKLSTQAIYNILRAKKNKAIKKPITIEVVEDYMPDEFIRIGLTETEALILAAKISKYLQDNFAGVSIYIERSIDIL